MSAVREFMDGGGESGAIFWRGEVRGRDETRRHCRAIICGMDEAGGNVLGIGIVP